MDSNNYYDKDYAFGDSYERRPKRGGSGFAIAVIVIALVLLALVIGMVVQAQTAPKQVAAASPTPESTQEPGLPGNWEELFPGLSIATASPAPEETPKPSPTPYEKRDMPAIDGVAPDISILLDNPIPDIYDAASPSVVGVLNYQVQSVYGRDVTSVYGSGTGFVVSSEGYILTNAHVVEGAPKVTVLLDSDEVDAVVIGSDTETDIAVLKVEEQGLTPLKCGDSDAVRVGEFALAIGNPLDSTELANTLTFGIISATSREITIDNYTNTYLQTDAAINFGNSGGPLLNLKGEVIGMNSAKTITAGYDSYGNAVSAEGIGFALPINRVLSVMQLLITKGHIERPGVGILVSTVTETAAEANGTPRGAMVESVVNGGPAQQAGLKAGDIIVEANGKSITEHPQLVDMIQSAMIGDEVRVKVYRGGEYLDLTISLADKSLMDFNDMEKEETQEQP